MSVTQRVLEQYPSLAFLLKDPEVGRLLRDAVDPNKGFSPSTFQAKLYETKWWRRQSETQRTWQILSKTDPGEAKRQRTAMGAAIRQQAAAFGTKMSNAEVRWIAESMLQRGQDPNGPELLGALAQLWSWKDRGAGQVAAARSQVQSLASQYFYTPANNNSKAGRRQLDANAVRIASGKDSLEAYQHRLQLDAMKRYPHMRDMIAAGMSPAEVIAPLRQIVAEEMEYGNPEQVDVLRNPVWRQLMGIRDPKSGKTRMMTETETIKLVRSQPTWWKTSNGRAADSTMSTALLNTFGLRKSSGG